jgi:L-lactate dehydrogenase complex protein LldG
MNATTELFKTQYEKLAGKVHFAASLKAAAEIVEKIATDSAANKAVFGPLSDDLEKRLHAKFRANGFPVVAIDTAKNAIADQINQADLGISAVQFGIAETGTIVEVAENDSDRLISSLPRVHIAFLQAAQIISSIVEAAPLLREIYQRHDKYCNITFISGPSRTADIEMKLFLGVHGPQESHVILCDF